MMSHSNANFYFKIMICKFCRIFFHVFIFIRLGSIFCKFIYIILSRKWRKYFLIQISIILLLGLSACSLSLQDKIIRADQLAQAQGMRKELVSGGGFVFTTYQRIKNPNGRFVFYLEGDGMAFVGRGFPSDNPTPASLMVLKLADLDSDENIIYLARPCQFTPFILNPQCNDFYWTTGRMSKDSVKAMNEVIKSISGKNDIHLVGFSGGGGMAVLLAAYNNQVKSIVTIAGNLDHEAFNDYHNTISRMEDSLNPINFSSQISHIPQLHLVGNDDDRVPKMIAKKYISSQSGARVRLKLINASHNSGWIKNWPHLMRSDINTLRAQ